MMCHNRYRPSNHLQPGHGSSPAGGLLRVYCVNGSFLPRQRECIQWASSQRQTIRSPSSSVALYVHTCMPIWIHHACMSPAYLYRTDRTSARTHTRPPRRRDVRMSPVCVCVCVCVCVLTCVSCIIQVVRDLERQRGVLHT
eukprot:COSAG05_NODE_4085_length_1680_cov_2.318153_2_plen_141_part_00